MTQHPEQPQNPQPTGMNFPPAGSVPTMTQPEALQRRSGRRGWMVVVVVVAVIAALTVIYLNRNSQTPPAGTPVAGVTGSVQASSTVSDATSQAQVKFVGDDFLAGYAQGSTSACADMSPALKADTVANGGLCAGLPASTSTAPFNPAATDRPTAPAAYTGNTELALRVCPQGIAAVLFRVGQHAYALNGRAVVVTLTRDDSSVYDWSVNAFAVVPDGNASGPVVLGQLCETGKVGGTT